MNVVGDFSYRSKIAATAAAVALALALGELDYVTGREATRDALRRPISLRALPRQAVEGVPQPIEIYTPNFAWT